jgi:UDP-glucose 4-epimerase
MTAAQAGLAETKVVVTGGAGFVGSHIVDLLVQSGCREVVVVDNMIRGRAANLVHAAARLGQNDPVRLVEADIRDSALMRALIAGADTVFHQAALRITHCAAEPREALRVMVDATFDVMEACVQHKVRKVVFASSASIYGMAAEFPTTESNHPYTNRTLYGTAKIFGEGLLRSANDMYGLDYVALRYFNVYGPRMDLHGRYTEVLIRWMERIAAGQPPIIFGDGGQSMDFVHVTDVARANLLAATSDATDVAINVGSATETTLIGLAQALAQAMGRPDLVPTFAPERSVNPVQRRLADTTLAWDALGFRTRVSLQDGLRELVAWWRAERPSLISAAE